jgi:hypothetical protein
MIVTLSMDKINIHSDGCCTLSNETLGKLAASGTLGRRKVSCKFYLNNRELQLICPMLKSPAKEKVVLWPAIKLPYRKYPVYVYLYAVALYLSSDLSMRDVAAKVRNLFGLDKFSHSTVSRSLKKLEGIVQDLGLIAADISENNKTAGRDTLVIRTRWNAGWQDNYRELLHILNPVLNKKQQREEYGSLLNYKYFSKFMKFLI